MTAEESLRRAEDLLSRVEQARARLETTDDPDAALDVLADLAELAKQVEAEIQRAKRDAEAEADAER
jgi:energy-converting hydrogenase A subunit M